MSRHDQMMQLQSQMILLWNRLALTILRLGFKGEMDFEHDANHDNMMWILTGGTRRFQVVLGDNDQVNVFDMNGRGVIPGASQLPIRSALAFIREHWAK